MCFQHHVGADLGLHSVMSEGPYSCDAGHIILYDLMTVHRLKATRLKVPMKFKDSYNPIALSFRFSCIQLKYHFDIIFSSICTYFFPKILCLYLHKHLDKILLINEQKLSRLDLLLPII